MDKNGSILNWKAEYSVGVKRIDDQHRKLFEMIQQLVDAIAATPREEEIMKIITGIAEYKVVHFATEEEYFQQFGFEGTADHIAAHRQFSLKVAEIIAAFQGDTIGLAFALVDFLEDWLIEHLMTMDQKYVKCFQEHGLV